MLKVIRLIVVVLVWHALHATAGALEGAVFEVPAGWRQDPRGGGLSWTPADRLASEIYVVLMAHRRGAPDSAEQELGKWWEMAGGATVPEPGQPATFELTTTTGSAGVARRGFVMRNGTRYFCRVAVFKHQGDIWTVMSTAGDAPTDEKYLGGLRQMISSLQFPSDAAASANGGAMPLADSTPGGAGAPPYQVLLTLFVQPNSSPSIYVYCVFADGSWLRTMPPRGLRDFARAAEQRRNPDSFGTWTRSNAILRLITFGRIETLYAQPDGTYLRQDQTAREARYIPVPASTGQLLEGRYVRDAQSNVSYAPSITFHADGSFEDRGAVSTLAADEIGVRFTDIQQVSGPGAGRYDIVNNTLTLRYMDRRVKPIAFLLLGRPDWIVLGKGVLFKKM